MGYVALVAAFILIAVALNGGLGQSVSRRIEYPELLTAIREDNVKAVANFAARRWWASTATAPYPMRIFPSAATTLKPPSDRTLSIPSGR